MISPIGSFREWVSIQKRSTATDTSGGRVVTWVDLVTSTATATRLPASVTPTTAGERMQPSATVGADQAYRVELRYRADVLPTMRVTWTPYQSTSAKTLEVRTVQAKGGARDAIQLECSEVI